MKVTIAIDSFKGSLSSLEAGNAIKNGIDRVCNAECEIVPMADGGEGTVEAVVSSCNGKIVDIDVTGPLGSKVHSGYGITPDGTAVIEMSSAAGITLVEESRRNPLITTTYGVGELINDAISKGCRNFIIGIGGSATNDGGVGMLQALGFEFLNNQNKQVTYGAQGLKDIVTVNISNANKALCECKFKVACDVKNVLCGDNGCSAIYGPQKGATSQMVKDMDAWLCKYAEITKQVIPNSDMNHPGSGAAGGMGFAFMSYLNAVLLPGIEIVADFNNLEQKIINSDIVITGEGKLDSQSVMGKTPSGVAKIAKKHGKTVIAFCGCASDDATVCNENGIDAYFPILRAPCTVEQAMDNKYAYKNLCDTAEQVFRLIAKLCKKDT